MKQDMRHSILHLFGPQQFFLNPSQFREILNLRFFAPNLTLKRGISTENRENLNFEALSQENVGDLNDAK